MFLLEIKQQAFHHNQHRWPYTWFRWSQRKHWNLSFCFWIKIGWVSGNPSSSIFDKFESLLIFQNQNGSRCKSKTVDGRTVIISTLLFFMHNYYLYWFPELLWWNSIIDIDTPYCYSIGKLQILHFLKS